jgi:hypothetical protein
MVNSPVAERVSERSLSESLCVSPLSLSLSFQNAYQGDLCITDSFLPGALGGLAPGIGFELRGDL